jgi:hypothetical protein
VVVLINSTGKSQQIKKVCQTSHASVAGSRSARLVCLFAPALHHRMRTGQSDQIWSCICKASSSSACIAMVSTLCERRAAICCAADLSTLLAHLNNGSASEQMLAMFLILYLCLCMPCHLVFVIHHLRPPAA